MADVYSVDFFKNQRLGSLKSAEIVLPAIADIFRPTSILDVGCGQGTWLKAAMGLGIPEVIGVDGAWAKTVLAVPGDNFHAFNVGEPFDLGRRFDVVMSLEVGEHIPQSCAEILVKNIIRHSDAAVFSAAIPFQGGTHHVNERWPSYWASLFHENGYRCFDFLRWRFWNDRRVETWYRQNIMIFANVDNPELIARLDALSRETVLDGLSVVHPEIWTAMMNSKSLRFQRAMKAVTQRLREMVSWPRSQDKHQEASPMS